MRHGVVPLTIKPVHQMFLELVRVHILFRNDLAAHGYPRAAHAVRIARDQRVPVRQRLAFGQQTIGARRQQSVCVAGEFRRHLHTIRHQHVALFVAPALAVGRVVVPADDIGEIEFAAVGVLELDQTATPAPVAQRFPFRRIHFFQCLGFPECRHAAPVR